MEIYKHDYKGPEGIVSLISQGSGKCFSLKLTENFHPTSVMVGLALAILKETGYEKPTQRTYNMVELRTLMFEEFGITLSVREPRFGNLPDHKNPKSVEQMICALEFYRSDNQYHTDLIVAICKSYIFKNYKIYTYESHDDIVTAMGSCIRKYMANAPLEDLYQTADEMLYIGDPIDGDLCQIYQLELYKSLYRQCEVRGPLPNRLTLEQKIFLSIGKVLEVPNTFIFDHNRSPETQFGLTAAATGCTALICMNSSLVLDLIRMLSKYDARWFIDFIKGDIEDVINDRNSGAIKGNFEDDNGRLENVIRMLS